MKIGSSLLVCLVCRLGVWVGFIWWGFVFFSFVIVLGFFCGVLFGFVLICFGFEKKRSI